MLSAILRSSLKDPLGPALDDFERQVKLYEDQSGRKIPEEVLAATLSARVENAAVSQHLALNAAVLDTYTKIREAIRTFVSATRSWGTDGAGTHEPMEVDALF